MLLCRFLDYWIWGVFASMLLPLPLPLHVKFFSADLICYYMCIERTYNHVYGHGRQTLSYQWNHKKTSNIYQIVILILCFFFSVLMGKENSVVNLFLSFFVLNIISGCVCQCMDIWRQLTSVYNARLIQLFDKCTCVYNEYELVLV